MPALRIPAVFMRGGTSKGVFFHAHDLPREPAARDALLLRLMGSPDPYGVQIDGMGGGSSSTSKVVVMSRSRQAGHDVDYLFGAVAIEAGMIDWSGNCGNLSAAVGPFAIAQGLVDAPRDGAATVRIWQANLGKTILATVPMRDGEVCETGDFMLDGVAFPSSEVRLAFLDPAGGDTGSGATLFPTGNPVDELRVPGFGRVEATLIDAGNPAVFVDAAVLGLTGVELRDHVNGDAALLARAELLRAHAAVAMGLAPDVATATRDRPATPKLAFFGRPQSYRAADGREVRAESIDLVARIFSMGRLHHAMTGTGAIAIASAAAVTGTVVSRLLPGAGATPGLAFGHPSGITRVEADVSRVDGVWTIRRVALSRSARVLMTGHVHTAR